MRGLAPDRLAAIVLDRAESDRYLVPLFGSYVRDDAEDLARGGCTAGEVRRGLAWRCGSGDSRGAHAG